MSLNDTFYILFMWVSVQIQICGGNSSKIFLDPAARQEGGITVTNVRNARTILFSGGHNIPSFSTCRFDLKVWKSHFIRFSHDHELNRL